MWNLPGPGLEPVSPALAGGFLTTALPGKPHQPLTLKDSVSKAKTDQLLRRGTTWSGQGLVLQALKANSG